MENRFACSHCGDSHRGVCGKPPSFPLPSTPICGGRILPSVFWTFCFHTHGWVQRKDHYFKSIFNPKVRSQFTDNRIRELDLVKHFLSDFEVELICSTNEKIRHFYSSDHFTSTLVVEMVKNGIQVALSICDQLENKALIGYLWTKSPSDIFTLSVWETNSLYFLKYLSCGYIVIYMRESC